MDFTMESNSELKEIELGILKEFVRICEDNKLRYFAVGGTALGAVRHEGFIPWDDDIDVALPREDYEKFLEIAQSGLPENFFLQTHKTDEEYPNCFAKVRDCNTTFIEKSASNINMNHGVYVDIFPLDGYPNGIFKRKAFHFWQHILRISISAVFLKEERENLVKRTVKEIIRAVIPHKTAVKELDRLYKKIPYRFSDIVGNFNGAWGEKEIMPREVFGDGIMGKFEQMDVRLPAKIDEYLTRLYGDYMVPPPIEKRTAHHYCTMIDLKKSYTEYMQ